MAENEVIDRIKKAWEMLSKSLDKANQEFLEVDGNTGLSDNYPLCWEEADVPFQLGRFFYSVKDDGRYVYHVEVSLKPSNFKGYDFDDNGNLDKVKNLLGTPKVDFLVEDKTTGPFAVVGEAKYFRYSIEGVSRHDKTVFREIDETLNRLSILKKEGICENAVFLVLDKYYHRKEPQTWEAILAKLEKVREPHIYGFIMKI